LFYSLYSLPGTKSLSYVSMIKIYVSGLYSGTNPQPGVGIARSLRQAYPDAQIIGVEYSVRCSGIHWKDLDDVWLHRPWSELNLDLHAAAIRYVLEVENACYLSCNDLETLWLSRIYPHGHPNLLTPPASALRRVGKPAVPAHEGLPVKIPTFITTDLPDWELHAFCRRHNWKIWLKGPYYEAIRISTWNELEHWRKVLSKAWHIDTLFLQAHVTGYEESIALSAYKGELLHCVGMRKRDLTELAKTWSGDISEVPDHIKEPLRKIIRKIGWTGGAELEMVRDADEQLWMLEWNPRYPAWIHGATIAGHNMPAILVESATGVPFPQTTSGLTTAFTRVVLEVPVNESIPLPPLPEPFAGGFGHSLKHPSGLLAFAGRLHEQEQDKLHQGSIPEGNTVQLPEVPETFILDIKRNGLAGLSTPSFLFLESTATHVFGKAQQAANAASIAQVQVLNAYSIKTNPDERMLRSAFAAGFIAEAISPPEVKAALKAGYRPDQIILNGPGKWWRMEALPHESLHAVFCDSTADLRRITAAIQAGDLHTNIVGVRLRTPNVASRFGVPIHSPESFELLIDAIGLIPDNCTFGVHFHMASSSIGVTQWNALFEAMLRWCMTIESLTGRRIECLDMGGGWTPDDWQTGEKENRFAESVKKVISMLPHVREVISEPGKAVSQPSMALAMRILEVQDHCHPDEDREIVVDGSIAELPMYFVHPHRILYQRAEGGELQPVGRGNTHLMGRLCMEHDVVAANVALPEDAKAGDLLVFCDAGAYDKSMSYVFGHG
jgi:diaminopimelate decarboxylase